MEFSFVAVVNKKKDDKPLPEDDDSLPYRLLAIAYFSEDSFEWFRTELLEYLDGDKTPNHRIQLKDMLFNDFFGEKTPTTDEDKRTLSLLYNGVRGYTHEECVRLFALFSKYGHIETDDLHFIDSYVDLMYVFEKAAEHPEGRVALSR